MHGLTTSIRLSPELNKKLIRATRILRQGKNRIIKNALEEFLSKIEHANLAEEARRQSLLVSQAANAESNLWEDNSDTSGWK